MDGPMRPTHLGGVVSHREARLLFWLAVVALVAVIATLGAGFTAILAGPALILFVAWLMAYVLEPFVALLHRHMPFKGRGAAVGVTYLVTFVIAFIVLAGAGIAIINAAIEFIENLPAILARVQEVLAPVASGLGLQLPEDGGNIVSAIQTLLRDNVGELSDAVAAAIHNSILLIAGLITAIFISIGLAIGEVSLLGWMRRFLPSSTYRDLTELEQAIAVSFGGFVRGRLGIGAIYGALIGVAALVFNVPYAPLIAVIAGLIVFIPFIGPLLGWAVLPAFAIIVAPDVVIQCLVVSLLGAAAIQVVITPFVMAGAVNMKPVAVFVVVVFGTSIAGVVGAIFAIPTAAAILAVTDYLRKRDVMLRSEDGADGDPPAVVAAPSPT
jgi:putative heme transporter